jgi:aspartate carbamoyltransferase catalytic subunit
MRLKNISRKIKNAGDGHHNHPQRNLTREQALVRVDDD